MKNTQKIVNSKKEQVDETKLQSQKFEFIVRTFPVEDPVLPAKQAISSPEVSFKVDVYTEFDPLNALILGWVNQTAQIPEEALEQGDVPDDFKFGKYDDHVIKEAQDYQNQLAVKLIDMGIEVVRVGDQDFFKKFEQYDDGEVHTGFHCYSARDLPMAYHDCIYEANSASTAMNIQIKSFEWIFNKLQEKGAKWHEIKGFRQSINFINPLDIKDSKESTDDDWEDQPQQPYSSYQEIDESDIPYWDSANMLRIGLDMLYLVSQSGNQSGYKFLKEFFKKKYNGKVRIHPIRKVYNGVHIDTTFTILGFNKKLGKNLVIADATDTTTPKNMPAIFRGKNWVVLQIKKYLDRPLLKGYDGLTSKKLGLNMLIINPDTVVVDIEQVDIIPILQFYGITCIKCRIPYGREYGGSFHCMTNDYNRTDVHGIKRILETSKQKLSKVELAGFFDPELLEFLEGKGDLQSWVQVCNDNNIFPSYVTDHEKKSNEKQ